MPNNEHGPFLFVDGHLGVPEKILYKSCLAALHAFTELRSKRLADQSDVERTQALCMTSVILLTLPDHQTALNFRRKLTLECVSTDSE